MVFPLNTNSGNLTVMRFFSRVLSLALLLGLLAQVPVQAQIIGKTTTGRRKPVTPPSAAEQEVEEDAPVIGPMRLFFLPLPLVIPIGDRKHPPGAPFIPPGQPVMGGEFFPLGLIAEESGEPGAVLDDFLIAPELVTRRQYQLYLMYLDVFKDHSHCHPFEPQEKDHRPEGWFDTLVCENPDQPITGIDWFDAFGYASWCGARLATDLEWERAGLAGAGLEWLGSWNSPDWYGDPDAIREQPRGPVSGTVTDGRWTFYQTMTVRGAAGDRAWRNIYTRSPDLGMRLAWSPPGAEQPPDDDSPDGDDDPAAADVPASDVPAGDLVEQTSGGLKPAGRLLPDTDG